MVKKRVLYYLGWYSGVTMRKVELDIRACLYRVLWDTWLATLRVMGNSRYRDYERALIENCWCGDDAETLIGSC